MPPKAAPNASESAPTVGRAFSPSSPSPSIPEQFIMGCGADIRLMIGTHVIATSVDDGLSGTTRVIQSIDVDGWVEVRGSRIRSLAGRFYCSADAERRARIEKLEAELAAAKAETSAPAESATTPAAA